MVRAYCLRKPPSASATITGQETAHQKPQPACSTCKLWLSTHTSHMLLQQDAAKAATVDRPVPSRVQRKLAKNARFMDSVVKSKASALNSVRQRVQKKQRTSISLTELAQSLPEVGAPVAEASPRATGHARGVNRRRAKTMYVEITSFIDASANSPQAVRDVTVAVGVAAPAVPGRPVCGGKQAPQRHPSSAACPCKEAQVCARQERKTEAAKAAGADLYLELLGGPRARTSHATPLFHYNTHYNTGYIAHIVILIDVA